MQTSEGGLLPIGWHCPTILLDSLGENWLRCDLAVGLNSSAALEFWPS